MGLNKYKIGIIEDHTFVLQAMDNYIGCSKEFDIVGTATDSDQAKFFLSRVEPDVVLVDLILGKDRTGGVEITKYIKKNYPGVKILGISAVDDPYYIKLMIRAGADGYVSKTDNAKVVLDGIHAVLDGKPYISDSIKLNSIFNSENDEESERLDSLSKREMQVFKLISSGEAVKTIAKSLDLSESSVNTYKSRMLKKLNCRNDVQLCLLAVRHHVE